MTTPDHLLRAAEGGDPEAQFTLARLLDDQDRHDEALTWLGRSVEGGGADAALMLGLRLFTGQQAPKRPAEGAELVARSAALGKAEACRFLAAFHAHGRVRPQSWDVALDALQRGAELGDGPCRDQLAFLTADAGAKAAIARGQATQETWAQARRGVEVDTLLRTVPAKELSRAPRIRTYAGFLSSEECTWLIEQARGNLTHASIYDDLTGGALNSERRSNTNCVFPTVASDVVHAFIRARITRAMGEPTAHFEQFSVLHYDPGQEFRRHVDFINPGNPNLAADLAEKGQRIATFLVYLNEDFDDAETEFPVLALKWKGKTGDAILFWNVEPNGAVDRRTLHAGRPPTRGEKWLLSQFIRDKDQPLL
jgi:hypothetical protein